MPDISYNRQIWPVYFLSGIFSIAFSSFIILTVPLSSLFWPGEPYHALEMGILLTTLFWVSSITGLIFGWFIDRYSRRKILLLISLMRGTTLIMISFAIEGQGVNTWSYFFVLVFIFAFFAGGAYPTFVSLANDVVPLNKRSQFFGYFSVAGAIFMMFGFLISGISMEFNAWRFYYFSIGLIMVCLGIIFYIIVKEPKRGSQSNELKEVLKNPSIKYEFKLDKSTIKKTMLSKTNLTALIEGIFTNIFMGSLDLIVLPYLQTPPHNISPALTGLFVVIFGGAGRIIGQVFLARLSDRLANKNPRSRLKFIIISLAGGSFIFFLIFFIPLPNLSTLEGSNIVLFFSHPSTYIIGIILMLSNAISSLYMINQPPVIQEINLPEAQGQIVSWNQFLEHIGYGMGPLIAGILISLFGSNYTFSALYIALFCLPGIILWILSLKWYEQDKSIISSILNERSITLNSKTVLK